MESVSEIVDVFLRIAVATVCGGILGFEREAKQKPAGLKTMVFVTVGSTIFTLASVKMAQLFGGDPTRLASNIATGIGFIGAGTIIQRGVERIEGLTTAAVIWTCGAIGIFTGLGYLLTSVLISVGGVVFLRTLAFFESKLLPRCEEINFSLTFKDKKEANDLVENITTSYNCPTIPLKIKKEEGRIEGSGCKIHTNLK